MQIILLHLEKLVMVLLVLVQVVLVVMVVEQESHNQAQDIWQLDLLVLEMLPYHNHFCLEV